MMFFGFGAQRGHVCVFCERNEAKPVKSRRSRTGTVFCVALFASHDTRDTSESWSTFKRWAADLVSPSSTLGYEVLRNVAFVSFNECHRNTKLMWSEQSQWLLNHGTNLECAVDFAILHQITSVKTILITAIVCIAILGKVQFDLPEHDLLTP